MYLCLKSNGTTCGGYTVVVLLLKLTSSKHRKLDISFFFLITKLWYTFVFCTRFGNVNAFFTQTNTYLDQLCEVDEPEQEEPDISKYIL